MEWVRLGREIHSWWNPPLERQVSIMHVPGVCQQRVQWGSSNLTQGLDQNSRTKGNGQKGEKYLIKHCIFTYDMV